MKILITGASGNIGAIVRETFASSTVVLLSRRPIVPSKNERWFRSGNLQDFGWWNSLPADSIFDVVFHLAESVKKSAGDEMKQKIIDGHVKFIRNYTNKGAKVIYPLTAYSYDKKSSSSRTTYAEIKGGVYSQLYDNARVSFPTLHPICDFGYGLGRLVHAEKLIPLVNVMCSFEATIPILRLEHLKRTFLDTDSMPPGKFDLYSEVLAIREIFKDEARANPLLISKCISYILKAFKCVPSIRLLIEGRQIA